jgi:pyridoxal/pyridoxine/pyridoxamine kinase
VWTAEVEAIRVLGFDVIAVPTNNFPNHGRVIHPDGVAGFTPANLQKLAAVFVNKKGL